MKMIHPETKIDSGLSDTHGIPYAPFMSDPSSFENIINLLYVINKFDSKFWKRGEVFGSILFVWLSLFLGYYALMLSVTSVKYYDIGKWNIEDDKTEMI